MYDNYDSIFAYFKTRITLSKHFVLQFRCLLYPILYICKSNYIHPTYDVINAILHL